MSTAFKIHQRLNPTTNTAIVLAECHPAMEDQKQERKNTKTKILKKEKPEVATTTYHRHHTYVTYFRSLAFDSSTVSATCNRFDGLAGNDTVWYIVFILAVTLGECLSETRRGGG